MIKVGIISEFKAYIGTNYGNKLQAYALNNYLNSNFNLEVYSISLSSNLTMKYTTYPIPSFLYNTYSLLKRKTKKQLFKTVIKQLEVRQLLFNNFVDKNIKFFYNNVNLKDLKIINFDCYIVGSDVVWSQNKNVINRLKFLDFKTKKDFYKISYAASFGRNYIPKENVKFVKKYLSQFDYLSVREKSSIDLLASIGVDNVKHVCDPTLLLDKRHWKKIERNPNLTSKKYIFTYLLGKDKKQRDYIMNFAREKKLIVVNIPYADGRDNDVDKNFGDIIYSDCSPENWVWLIDNAEFVFTDSFHGLIFSTIFEKKFVILKRYYNVDINNRILDYLKKIKQEDKFLDIVQSDINYLKWNYKLINNILKDFIDE